MIFSEYWFNAFHPVHFPEILEDGLRIRIAAAQEIEIARTTKRLVEPDHQQHDALENDLLDTNVVPELRRPRPHRGVLNWIGDVPADRLFLSAVTVGEIQAGIEIARERDAAKAEKLETRLDRVVSGYGVLPMDAPAFREWARLKHGKSDTPIEDAMIAATARVRRLTVATRNVRDFPCDVAPFTGGGLKPSPRALA